MNLNDLLGLARGFGSRFGLVSLLPTGALVTFVLFLVWGGAPQQEPSVDEIVDHAESLDGWSLAVLFLGIALLTLVLEPLQLLLVRLYEGYHLPGPLVSWGTRRQAAKRQVLVEAATHRGDKPTPAELAAMGAADSALHRRFPDRRHLLPTALGNALRAAESGAGRPYGLDAVIIWPRLYAVLSEGTRALVDDQRDSLDRSVRFAAAFLLGAGASAVLLAPHRWWAVVPVACAALAWIAYRAAVQAAIAYGEGIRLAIDLHRFDLLTALHLPLPADIEAERAANERLSQFLRQGWPADLQYDHDGPDPAP